MSFFKEVYKTAQKIPQGKVTTYGEIAKALGKPQNARIVGYALHVNPDPDNIPCHRVVNRFGGLAKGFGMGGPEKQKALLKLEGIEFMDDNMINLDKYGWKEVHSQ